MEKGVNIPGHGDCLQVLPFPYKAGEQETFKQITGVGWGVKCHLIKQPTIWWHLENNKYITDLALMDKIVFGNKPCLSGNRYLLALAFLISISWKLVYFGKRGFFHKF